VDELAVLHLLEKEVEREAALMIEQPPQSEDGVSVGYPM